MRYGYACINMTLRNRDIYVGRTMQKKAFLEKGLPAASSNSLSNLNDMLEILKWNLKNNILVYRMSSDMLPWMSEYNIRDLPDYAAICNILQACGSFVAENNMRLSFHPGPFNCLASEDANVIGKAISELDKHSEVMDIMGLPQSRMAKINIHIGGAYGDKDSAMLRFCNNYIKLSSSTRTRLTIENDDRESMFGPMDLYRVYRAIGTPIVFDGHHFEVGQRNNLSYEEAYSLCYSTWECKPTFHWSNSAKIYEEKKTSLTTHSDWYYKPMPLLDLGDIDIILESKMKELALIDYIKKFC